MSKLAIKQYPQINVLTAFLIVAFFLPGVVVGVIACALYFDLTAGQFLDDTPTKLKYALGVFGNIGHATFPIAGSLSGYLFFRWIWPRLRKTKERLKYYELAFGSMFLSLLYCGVSIQLLKRAIGRQRPYVHDFTVADVIQPMSSDWVYHSFPSGHSQVITCVATSVCIFFPRLRIPAILIAFTVALSRVITTNHFLSDIIGGAYFALLGTLFVTLLLTLPKRDAARSSGTN